MRSTYLIVFSSYPDAFLDGLIMQAQVVREKSHKQPSSTHRLHKLVVCLKGLTQLSIRFELR